MFPTLKELSAQLRFRPLAKIFGVQTNIRGKVGNAVYSVLHGVQIYKTRPVPQKRNSLKQQKHRDKFKHISYIFKFAQKNWLLWFWKPSCRYNQTAWANMLKVNLASQTADLFEVARLVPSVGSLENFLFTNQSYDTATGFIVLNWKNIISLNGSSSDVLNFMVVDVVNFYNLGMFFNCCPRSALTFIAQVRSGLSERDILVFATISQSNVPAAKTNLISNSLKLELSRP